MYSKIHWQIWSQKSVRNGFILLCAACCFSLTTHARPEWRWRWGWVTVRRRVRVRMYNPNITFFLAMLIYLTFVVYLLKWLFQLEPNVFLPKIETVFFSCLPLFFCVYYTQHHTQQIPNRNPEIVVVVDHDDARWWWWWWSWLSRLSLIVMVFDGAAPADSDGRTNDDDDAAARDDDTDEQSTRSPPIQDDDEGHLICHSGDLLHKRCSWIKLIISFSLFAIFDPNNR